MKYRCGVCGYIYDEEKEGVRFEDLPDDWQCPVCGEGKEGFEPVEEDEPGPASAPAATARAPEISAWEAEELRELTAGQLSALCSNLQRGCGVQQLGREAELFGQIADYFESRTVARDNDGVATILSLIYCYLMYGYFRNRLGKAVDERTEYLLSVIPFAPEEDGEPAYLEEREAILYKGEVYLFREGKLEGSHPASEEETRTFLDGVEEEEEGKPSFLERLRALVPWKKGSSGDEHKDEGSE